MTNVIDAYELSPMQAGMLYHAVSGGPSGLDIEQVIATLDEPLEEEHLLRAWERVVERQPVLRTRFRWEGVAVPVQEVVNRVEIPVERFDWRALSRRIRDQRFEEFLEQDRIRGLDLSRAPLMRLAFVYAADREFRMVWTFSHALLDGRSFYLVLREVFTYYEAFSRGGDADLPPARPYRDYIEWRRGLDHGAAKSFWLRALSGFRAPTPLVVADAGGAAEIGKSDRGAVEIRLPLTSTNALRECARQASVTVNTLVQGAWALLLHRYSGESDVVFGATRACRRSSLGGADDLVGLFINTLPLRVGIDPRSELIPWLQQLRAQQVALRTYEHTPLADAQRWSDLPPGTPLFESILLFENQTLDARLRALGATWTTRRFQRRAQNGYPLTILAFGDPELLLMIEYSRRRFAFDVVMRMLSHLRTLLEGMVAHPKARLEDLPLLTEPEQHQLVVSWNATTREYGTEARLHRLIEVQAGRTPQAVALEFEGRELTFAQLNERANRLARVLRAKGVGPDVLVAVFAERSFEMVVSLVAILKAGGAYVPLDPSYPGERLRHMLEDARAPLVLAQPHLVSQLPVGAAQVLELDASWAAYAGEAGGNLEDVGTPEDLAYVIFTSGSTGRPKGGMNEHRGICNRLLWMQEEYGLTAEDRVLQKTPFSFDVSVWEFFWPLMTGARLVIARPEGHRDSAYLVRLIRESGITTMHFVPSMLRVFLEEGGVEACGSLRRVICSGEALSHELQERFFARLPGTELHNLYGPTEAAVDVTYWACRRGDERLTVPIGRPVANTQIYVLDAQMRPVPVGVAGELYIGGVQVGRGYVSRPDLTAERFVPDPFSGRPGARLYRTGDSVRYLPDGAIEYLGRLDHQVKVRGQRIELGEIEAVLAEHPDVRQAVVYLWKPKADDMRIVACCAPVKAGVLAPIKLRKYLRDRLPEYMIPQYFLPVEEIPLLPNGKVDRHRLPTPVSAQSSIGQHEAPADPVEAAIAEIWTKLIQPARPIGRSDRFFEMGGHSLLGLQALGQMEQKLGVRLDFRVLFQESLADLATRCRPERVAQGLEHGGAAIPVV